MIKDLTGQRFGRLVALRESSTPYISPKGKPARRWVCRCDCGKEITVLQNALTSKTHPTLSCGCSRSDTMRSKAIDMTGQRFGRLVVLGPAELPKKRGWLRLGWRCRCDCGNEIIAVRRDLTGGKLLSCGCWLREEAADTIHERVKHQYGTTLTAINPERGANRNSKSGVRGVYWSNREGRWVAKIGFQNRTITIGRFTRLEDAIQARKDAEKKYFEPLLEKSKEENTK